MNVKELSTNETESFAFSTPLAVADTNVCTEELVDGVPNRTLTSIVLAVTLVTDNHLPLTGSAARGYDLALPVGLAIPTLTVIVVPVTAVIAMFCPD